MGFDAEFNQEIVNAHYREELRKGTNLYGSGLSQTERFRNALRYFSFDGKNVLEVGCGKGDFLVYLMNKSIQYPSLYVGLDPLREMIDLAAERLRVFPGIRLLCCDYLDMENVFKEPIEDPDIIVAFSVFDKKFGNLPDSKSYAWRTIEKMIYDAKEGIYITFLSAHKTVNDFSEALFYPMEGYRFAHRLAERVVIDNSYMPHAFSLVVYNQKSPWREGWEKK